MELAEKVLEQKYLGLFSENHDIDESK